MYTGVADSSILVHLAGSTSSLAVGPMETDRLGLGEIVHGLLDVQLFQLAFLLENASPARL